MQANLSLLTDFELDEFIRIRGLIPPIERNQKITLTDQLLTQLGQVTEAISDLVIANNVNITSKTKYTKEQINSIDINTLDAFARIFGLTKDIPNIISRIIRIKGLLQEDNSLELMMSNLTLAGGNPKQRSDAEKEVQDMTVTITGARPDEYLIGVRNVTRDAMIKIRNVTIPAYKKTLDNIRVFPDLWTQFLDKLGSIEFFLQ